ncbi:hypothetical protein AVJ24_19715 [Yersinia pestis]|nr:hypothetical protein AVJ24_19715 [Yersinia pestis]
MNKTTVKAEFSICGDIFDPNEITTLLQIEPMEVHLKGVISGTRKDRAQRLAGQSVQRKKSPMM